MTDPNDIWTVYNHPDDFPDHVVARRHVFTGCQYVPSPTEFKLAGDLVAIYAFLEDKGLVPLDRYENDDSNILETWMYPDLRKKLLEQQC
jgi:hypothetical protein